VIPLAFMLALVTSADTARVVPNDNRAPAGRLHAGVLTVRLEARQGTLFPEGEDGPGVTVLAFAEAGRAPSAPGPLVRVRAGTEVRVTLRNTLPVPLTMIGLQDHPAAHLDTVIVAAGAEHDFAFRATTPGTYIYLGRTSGGAAPVGFAEDCQLVGAVVVDPPQGSPPDRIMMITLWADDEDSARAAGHPQRETLLVNGLAWPYTERLGYTVGDSVRWRVINASVAPHPMHLHGFYYRVDSRGGMGADSVYAPEQQRLAVTEYMAAATTMALTWSPDRAGNWLFHCHLIAHIASELRLRPEGRSPHAAHGADEASPHMHHSLDGMSGLVVGIHVRPKRGAAPVADPTARRWLRGFVTERDSVFRGAPGFSFVLQEGSRPPARDSMRFPGSMVTLVRGEPTEIVVTNRSREAVTIHWHGIELESYYDGVGGWSGQGSEVAPPIEPGDTFVVRLTPDRAGTFIYHTHMDEGGQLSTGLYGPLIVLEPGQTFDTTSERILLLGAGGPQPDAPQLVNGSATPAPMAMTAGHTYRLRIINIAASSIKSVRLLADSAVQQWRGFAKDGAYFPEWQKTMRPARLRLGPGETYDFEFTPAARDFTLEVTTFNRGRPPAVLRVPIQAR
jgi:FtsP/CotA-like multicopper oxidase with cupredoxin domain